jgi:hypothetical protein
VAHAVGAVLNGLALLLPAPRAALRLLSAEEWAAALGQDGDEWWERGALRGGLVAGMGLSATSKQLDWLAAALAGLAPAERRAFMEFALGAPKMPTGGLRAKPLTVCLDRSAKERSLPAANTCAFRITLPDYPSQEALAAKLRYAIAEGRKFFDKT